MVKAGKGREEKGREEKGREGKYREEKGIIGITLLHLVIKRQTALHLISCVYVL